MSMIELKVETGHETSEYSEQLKRRVTVFRSGPDSAGGVDARVSLMNTTGKEIKYLMVTCIPYNSVRDIVAYSIGDQVEANLQVTGPIRINADSKVVFEGVWYNHTIVGAQIKQATIQYMDGSEETLSEDEIVLYGSEGSMSGEKQAKLYKIIKIVIAAFLIVFAKICLEDGPVVPIILVIIAAWLLYSALLKKKRKKDVKTTQ